jgi:hypothetical protein
MDSADRTALFSSQSWYCETPKTPKTTKTPKTPKTPTPGPV